MKKNKTLLAALILAQPLVASATNRPTNDMFGVWGAVTVQGDFSILSPSYNKIKWLVMNQTRTRDDTVKLGNRFTEDLLFSQVGYQATSTSSFWMGYVHDWVDTAIPGKSSATSYAYEESRPYQDFLLNTPLNDSFRLTARTRLEERFNQTSGNVGIRPRQLLQINYALPFYKPLSLYVGDEVFWYVNQNQFGRQGFSENRATGGLSWQATKQFGLDVGYLGQYANNIYFTPGTHNTFTHNFQVNFRYRFD